MVLFLAQDSATTNLLWGTENLRVCDACFSENWLNLIDALLVENPAINFHQRLIRLADISALPIYVCSLCVVGWFACSSANCFLFLSFSFSTFRIKWAERQQTCDKRVIFIGAWMFEDIIWCLWQQDNMTKVVWFSTKTNWQLFTCFWQSFPRKGEVFAKYVWN